MTQPFELIYEWLRELDPAPDQKFVMTGGYWASFAESQRQRYVAYQAVGGISPRELNTRMIDFSVTVVGQVGDGAPVLMDFIDKVFAKADAVPENPCIVAVNVIGDMHGPVVTEGGRPVMAMTLQMII